MVTKKYLNTAIFLLFIPIYSVYSQTIKGNILDSANTPVPFATVAFLNPPDSAIIEGVFTNENGNFEMKIGKGIYLLKVSAIGFNTKCCDTIRVESNPDGKIIKVNLITNSLNLNEVSVTAVRSAVEFSNGNITINIENSPLAKGNTVYDLFSKMPGVSIDDNIIYLNGKPGVTIMIDGRVQQISNSQLLNLLKNMNAESVEKIELFKNPPVIYDASGTSGMINIKTKKTRIKGYSGSAYTSSSQGFYSRTSGGMLFNYKTDRILFFSNLDCNYSFYQVIANFNRKFKTDTSLTELNTNNAMKNLESGLTFKIGADWTLNKRNIVGFKIDGGPGSYVSNSTGITKVQGYNNLNFDHLNSSVYNPDKWVSNNFNLNSEHHFDTLGTVLFFTSDFTRLSESISSDIQNYYMDKNNLEVFPSNIYRNHNINGTDIFAAKMDFSKFINEKTTLQAGIKTSVINTNNNYLFERKDYTTGNYFEDTALTNNYTYQEQTYAAYLNFEKKVGKLNAIVGVRAENTNLTGQNTEKAFEIKRNYYNLFPNISIEYSPSEKHYIQINFNRRIDRPQYNDLNPFRYYRDQFQFYEGNPFLLPHYSNVTLPKTRTY